MDSILDNIGNALFNGQLPAYWAKLAPATCKQLGGWMDHLQVKISPSRVSNFFNVLKFCSQIKQRRAVQFKNWAASGEPLVMWISGLHIPESYLTALVQVIMCSLYLIMCFEN